MDKRQRARLASFGQQGQMQKRTFQLTAPAQTGPVKISYGHDGLRMFIVFERPTDHVALDDNQMGEMLAAIESTREKLRAHIRAGGQPVSHGTGAQND